MPVSFDRCECAAFRNHPQVAALVLSEVKSALLVPGDLDPTNGELGRAATADTGPAVYVLTDKKVHCGVPMQYSLKVFFNGQTYRLILEDEPGWIGKKAVEIQMVTKKEFVKGQPIDKRRNGNLARQRWNASFQQLTSTIADQSGSDGSNAGPGFYANVKKS
jgi:hypothetical protein